MFLSRAEGGGFAPEFAVAEEAGVGSAVAVAANEPAMGAFCVDATDAFEGGFSRWHLRRVEGERLRP